MPRRAARFHSPRRERRKIAGAGAYFFIGQVLNPKIE
jgi:hypothetical protein